MAGKGPEKNMDGMELSTFWINLDYCTPFKCKSVVNINGLFEGKIYRKPCFFTIKYRGFLYIFPSSNSMRIFKCWIDIQTCINEIFKAINFHSLSGRNLHIISVTCLHDKLKPKLSKTWCVRFLCEWCSSELVWKQGTQSPGTQRCSICISNWCQPHPKMSSK